MGQAPKKNNWIWWIIGIILVIVIFFVFIRPRMQASQVTAAQTEIEDDLGNQVATRPPVNVQNLPLPNGGTSTSGVVLTGTQCRQTLRGKCGRKCILPRQKCEARRQCWQDSKVSICGWAPDSKMDID